MSIRLLQAFIAGFVSTMAFHQGLLALLHSIGMSTKPAYDMTPMPPLGFPSVILRACSGGFWGVALWLLIRGTSGYVFLAWAVALGALLPSIVVLFVLPSGRERERRRDPRHIFNTLLLNGAWGLGMAWLMRLMAHAR